MSHADAGPNILHIIPQDAWGGVESAARSAAEADCLDCNLVVMVLAGRSLVKNRKRIVDHPERTLNSPTTYSTAIREVLQRNPDVLICSLWRSVLVGAVVKMIRPRTRLVCFLHNTSTEHVVDWASHKLALALADEVWSDSAATLSARVQRARRTKRVISFVTEHRQSVTGDRPAPRFVSWTRLHSQKGHDRSIRLIDALVRRGFDARLEIWGSDNGAGPALRQLVESLGLGSRITFPGPIQRERIEDLAANHSFFLLLSRYEGMAMAVVEAMQMGLVPVATGVGQIAAYVRDDVNGILVDPGDLDRTVDQLQRLLENPEAYAAMSKAAAATWESHPLYADDVCKSALALWDAEVRRTS